MKYRYTTCFAVAAATGLLYFLLTGFTGKTGTRTDEIKELERIVTVLEKAVSEGDPGPWAEYMAADGILVNRDGNTNTRQEILDELKPLPKGKILEIRPVNFRVYLNGSSAMVSFLADEKLSIWGQAVDTRYPSVMYFEKRAGKWQMLYFTYFEKPVDPAAFPADRARLESYTGTYRVSDELKITVTATDSGLLYKKPGSSARGTLLYPVNDRGHFFRAGTETEYIFTTDAKGRELIRQRRNWIDLVWYKESSSTE